jgi:tRNA nucleotidyltransferase (CCA-adding enzyme)
VLDLILCHTTADFDAVGAAVGLTRLKRGSKIVLTGGAHPAVRDFLALHRDEYNFIERRSVDPKKIRSLIIVDTQSSDRLGKCKKWLDLPEITIEIYDHHLDTNSDITVNVRQIEEVGASATIIAEKLQEEKIQLTPFEATVMGLGIHVDTGSLTYDQTTPRDAKALAWLMEQGANVKIIAEYVEPSLSPQLQQLFTQGLDRLKTTIIQGYSIATVLLDSENFVPGLSNLTARMMELTECDAMMMAHRHYRRRGEETHQNEPQERLTIIGRSRIEETNLHHLFAEYGGGGHSQAASLSLKNVNSEEILQELLEKLKQQIPHPLTARDIMSSPVRTIRPQTTIEEAERILFRYGHSGLSVVNENDQLVGIISRRDLDLALHHGFSHAPVKGYMTQNLKTITPDTPLPEIEGLMVTYDVGRLPVLEKDKLMGIVTRTDVLRQLHQDKQERSFHSIDKSPHTSCLLPSIQDRLAPEIWAFLNLAAKEAQKRGWHLYLVGGAVRDILLSQDDENLLLQDIDLVVDGFHNSADVGAGVELAKQLQQIYPEVRLSIHGSFQTAALLWHKDPIFNCLWVDIATARTEFYPYPAANPEVEASSIRQDLYRRDFTINALAIRLTQPRGGELLDFFGGLLDLKAHEIKVLHPNSFIEDPTRIYRAVRFAVRLNFTLEIQTQNYIRYGIESGIYDRLKLQNNPAPALTTRLRAELQYILEAGYWKKALKFLDQLNALKCLHPDLQLTPSLWWQIRLLDRWLKYLDPQHKLNHWLMRLEILILGLKNRERGKLATNLHLPKESIERLIKFQFLEENILDNLLNCEKLSQKVKLLSREKKASLILLGAKSPKNIRKIIWQYLTHWSKIKAPINGDDLIKMGYKPGPQFQRILEEILIATLDDVNFTKDEIPTFLEILNSEK